jgi:MSHA biogenesis protein MshL
MPPSKLLRSLDSVSAVSFRPDARQMCQDKPPLRARPLMIFAALLVLSGCVSAPVARVDNHLRTQVNGASANAPDRRTAPPAIVQQVPLPPAPKAAVEDKRYSVAVVDVPARDILLAISRDTGINIDIHPGIEGRVTLNAIDQTVRQILTRMSKQIDMRWETDGPNLSVMPDVPYLKLYRVDYVNINRDTQGTFGVQTQVVAPAGATQANATGGAGGGGGAQNSSQIRVENSSKNRFWESLERNVKELLRETDKLLPEGSSETVVRSAAQGANTGSTRTQSGSTRANANRANSVTGPSETQQQSESVSQTLTFREAASVIVNPETGTISVRATSRQHEKVSQFIEQVSGVAKRQVLIEATIVEVNLNDTYQTGVDWSILNLDSIGFTFRQQVTPTVLRQDGPAGLTIGYANPTWGGNRNVSSTVRLLETFGTTRVLSSPRTTTLNNQTAVLKVVENQVYFTVRAEVTPATSGTVNSQPVVAYTSTPNVVPIGFVMSVTPQIGENDVVTLNVRPSITSSTRTTRDPNPDLARAGVVSTIPIIQTREFETVLRIPSGQTAVLGGLMQDSVNTSREGLPFFSRVPFLGDAVSYRNDEKRRSELIVFIRPVVIKDASVETDLAEYRRYLPDRTFFKEADALAPLSNDAAVPKK